MLALQDTCMLWGKCMLFTYKTLLLGQFKISVREMDNNMKTTWVPLNTLGISVL